MCKTLAAFLVVILAAMNLAAAREWSVAQTGSDANDGSSQKPLRTISAAARQAQPGDVITIHAGIYRERVDPPRGGTSDDQRITYQSASGERVEIAGSEVVNHWVKAKGDVWKVTLPNSFFGSFNPYSVLIRGDWFEPGKRQHHTGAVYLNGVWLTEAAALDEVMKTRLWFGNVDKDSTTIWAQFPGVDPNTQTVEINVRQTVFYPSKTGINYITLRGLTLRDAATPWAPPTTEQIALVGVNWSKGWIIENNIIRHSICTGVSLGKYGDASDSRPSESATGYVATVERAEKRGWNGDIVGHHIVRNNDISECDQAGINGSLGAIFSQVTGNFVHDIGNKGRLTGAEIAGIKFHGATDVLIRGNRVGDCQAGLWMDWMAQGLRVTGNLFYNNGNDLIMEVNHGPYLVDNNIFLSVNSLLDVSEGGAFVHNLFAGTMHNFPDDRETSYFAPHSTKLLGIVSIQGGGDRFYNNIFVGDGKPADGILAGDQANKASRIGYGLAVYDTRKFPLQTSGNIYLFCASPSVQDTKPGTKTGKNPRIRLVADGNHMTLHFEPAPADARTKLVTTELLGLARVPQAGYENPDGSPLQIDTDYFGAKRDTAHPAAGPFEKPGKGTIQVW